MKESSYLTRVLGLVVALMMVAAACGGGTSVSAVDDDDGGDDSSADAVADEPEPEPEVEPEPEPEPTDPPEPTATPEPEPTDPPEPTATPEPVMSAIVPSFLGAQLLPYGSEDITVGEVKAYWYNGSNGFRVVLYHGQGMTDLTRLCPGNSINTSVGFEFISNTPADPGACDGFPTDLSLLRVCTGGVVLYETKIPNGTEGTFFASMEWNAADGSGITGLTSSVPSQPDLPEIDLDADAYAIDLMFTSDGSEKMFCGPWISDGVNA